ncbi:membrane-bound lytic murein transglycosylase MltF [Cellvibrio sp. ARAG 10.3]|uniref:membrane-bound lytic murein transglycosylase MltF n=1 Tax=Cellvibrio sp. ARAG 10.3 TaxID=3451358 RepID=UPI003F44D5E2
MEIGKRKAAQRMISNLFSGLSIIAISLMLVRSYLPSTLEKVLTDGQLRVISRNGPTTYYEGPEGLTGFEYSLVKGFADELGVDLVIQDEDSFSRIFNAVGKEQNHLAAAGITVTPARSKGVKFTRPFMKVKQQLIYNSRQPAPRSILDLMGKDLVVISESSHVERLQELRETYPELTWREEPALEMIELLEMIHKGLADYAIVDSNSYDLNRHAYPRAQTAFDISDAQDLAWAFAYSIDTSLFDAAQAYLERIEQDGTLAALTDQFYKPIVEVTTGDALLFSYRLEKRLPRWEDGLKEAAAKFDLDWQLLAAISYQESHWNPAAESRTGVRGLMMLTLAAASDMGVKDRIDPSQSIYGGAKYFRNLLDRIPARVTGDDRMYMALAAYNVGMGHLEDARVLTEIHGDDPNKWGDVRKYLPLLAKRQYYSKTKHGYARGWEPVAYVKNVRNYHKILAWHSQHEQRRLAVTHDDETDVQIPLESTESLQPVKSKFSRNSFNTSSLSVL